MERQDPNIQRGRPEPVQAYGGEAIGRKSSPPTYETIVTDNGAHGVQTSDGGWDYDRKPKPN